ncbi:MAG TPA: hypothetical protein VFM05_07590 [Candidatus Saccharimonadales bacterium]|nr:hypothetical protein [Candidatus Saccharimonadales bacterium]
MATGIFYRNVRSRSQLELFLLAAVSSVLLVRLYLEITGYPQIGTGGLHIAHMLWGGVLMLGALIVALSFLGARAQRLVAVVGGIGFGVFIDELGKFITRDNNYFYKPTIGLIYATFTILYLSFNFLSRPRALSSREYQLNALAQLEEAIVNDLSPTEKARVQTLLAQADQKDPITRQLQKLLASVRTIPPPLPRRSTRIIQRINRCYELFWHRRRSDFWVRSFFLLEAGVFVVAVIGVNYASVDSAFDIFKGGVPYSVELVWGQLLSSLVAAGFAVYGAIVIRISRYRAYEQFRRATMINVFLTQFFMFSRIELAAIPGFFFNLLLLGLIGYAMHQELRLRTATAS